MDWLRILGVTVALKGEKNTKLKTTDFQIKITR